MDVRTAVPPARNEPIRDYSPDSPDRAELQAAIAQLQAQGPIELPAVIDGEPQFGTGPEFAVTEPHAHRRLLGTSRTSTVSDTQLALAAARRAAPGWAAMDFDDRAGILLRAAELLAGPWRARLNAATMLGQSKTVYQAEIDSACELIDFWRFNVEFASEILAQQPRSAPGTWNRTDHRPLEGFVYAISPFNFTAIAGNLPTAPALMGNVVIWKPARTQQFAAHFVMQLLQSAGLPPGVINMLPGDGSEVSQVTLADPDLAGIHFTGSTAVFQQLWRTVGQNLDRYRSYPRIVGETGGKNFVVAHPSADPAVLRTALVRGAFEYQGQKCSAASRAYLPRSLWHRMGDELLQEVESIQVGPVTDFGNFMGALIDEKAYQRVSGVIHRAAAGPAVRIVAGGECDDSEGWFIRPTVLLGNDPASEYFTTEYFGPVLSLYLYDDDQWPEVLDIVDASAPYALTGSVICQDRTAIAAATERLRFAAGNFYLNDKPTGAVVGQQPFGGSRASGTNDKAGSAANLLRWTSPRSVKETFVPPTDYQYPHMR